MRYKGGTMSKGSTYFTIGNCECFWIWAIGLNYACGDMTSIEDADLILRYMRWQLSWELFASSRVPK